MLGGEVRLFRLRNGAVLATLQCITLLILGPHDKVRHITVSVTRQNNMLVVLRHHMLFEQNCGSVPG